MAEEIGMSDESGCHGAGQNPIPAPVAMAPGHTDRIGAMRLLCLLALVATPAAAQDTRVEADLDGDGVADFAEITWTGDGSTTLAIGGAYDVELFENPVWAGTAAGQAPWLELAPNGSLRLMSANYGIGREIWTQTLTIVHRDGAWRVGGFTYEWADRIEPGTGGLCDLNLLSGRGVISVDSGRQTTIDVDTPALPLGEWTDATMPQECEAIFTG